MTMPTADKDRVSARIPRASRKLLEQAAALSGATLNQFVVQAAVKEAHALLSRDQTIVLNAADTARFFAALERPPAPNAVLRKAAKAYRRSKLHAKSA
jgi:uncharacterized protein (DUF1778 family)